MKPTGAKIKNKKWKSVVFIEDRFFYKDLTREMAKKRIGWFFIVLLMCFVSIPFVAPRFDQKELAIFSTLFIFVFGVWPMTRVRCPKCKNKSWFTFVSASRIPIIYSGLFFDQDASCANCGYKFR